MLHPSTTITWLDLDEPNRVYHGTLDVLFTKYADRVHYIGADTAVIAFGSENGPKLKIQDWEGWTNLMTVWKHINTGERWMNISVKDHPDMNILISDYELTPVYDPETTKKGFHGEIKFSYRLKHPEKILSTDHMRVRGVEDFGTINPQFTEVSIDRSDDDVNYGYQAYTLSSFMSGNGFHLYATDDVDVQTIIGKGLGYR